MIEFVLGAICLGVLALVWFVIGLMNRREDEHDFEMEELKGVLNVRRNIKDKLRDDPKHTERVHKQFND